MDLDMSGQRKMSVSCRIELDSVVRDLQGLRKGSGQVPIPEKVQPLIQRTDSTVRGLPLLSLLAEEAKFLRGGGVKPSSTTMVLLGNLGLPEHGPLAQGAMFISTKAEEASNEPNYHNQQHVVEVIVAAYILGRREKLPVYRIAELVIAAGAHDLGHTGQINRHDFERESCSFHIAQPILEQVGLPETSIQRIEKMILATDFRAGVPSTRQNYLDTRALDPMDESRLLASQCLLLTEADILFSCFDLSYNEFLSKLLSAEWNRPSQNLSIDERVGFLSSVQFISEAALQLGLENRRLRLLKELEKSGSSS